MKVNQLLLLSKNDIPFESARLIVHQPSIKQIAYIGQRSFFSGCEYLSFSKNKLKQQDKVRLKDVGALAASNYGEYWIADRDVWKNSYITIVLTYIGWDGNQNRYEAASMKYDGDKIGFTEETKKIRPIFCLNNVKITGGKGTSDEPYTLGV